MENRTQLGACFGKHNARIRSYESAIMASVQVSVPRKRTKLLLMCNWFFNYIIRTKYSRQNKSSKFTENFPKKSKILLQRKNIFMEETFDGRTSSFTNPKAFLNFLNFSNKCQMIFNVLLLSFNFLKEWTFTNFPKE